MVPDALSVPRPTLGLRPALHGDAAPPAQLSASRGRPSARSASTRAWRRRATPATSSRTAQVLTVRSSVPLFSALSVATAMTTVTSRATAQFSLPGSRRSSRKHVHSRRRAGSQQSSRLS